MLLRMADACPWYTNFMLLRPVRLLTDTAFLQRFTELLIDTWSFCKTPYVLELASQYQLAPDVYRPMIFANSRIDEVIFFLLLLAHWIFEWTIAVFAFFVFLLVPVHITKYFYERKPATLRILIILVLLQVVRIVCQRYA
jgi:hypothetical protein